MRINNILFPTDFSGSSKNALFYALHLAKATKANIILFHAYRIPITTEDMPSDVIEGQVLLAENEVKSDLEQLISDSRRYSPSIGIRYLIKSGFLETYIKDVVEEEGIDLIVMHTKGANLFQSLIIGTNAGQILEKVSCPVLVLPDNYNFKPYKHILFASKYLGMDVESLKYLTELSSLFHPEIVVVNIYSKEESIETELKVRRNFENFIKERVDFPKLKFSCLQGEDVVETMDAYISEHPTDLLVMSTYHRGILEKIYDRSLTKKMSYHTQIPLLVFHVNEAFG